MMPKFYKGDIVSRLPYSGVTHDPDAYILIIHILTDMNHNVYYECRNLYDIGTISYDKFYMHYPDSYKLISSIFREYG